MKKNILIYWAGIISINFFILTITNLVEIEKNILITSAYASDKSIGSGHEKSIHAVKHQEGRNKKDHQEHVVHEEAWWRFPGWQILFAGISCFYFIMVLMWLPLIVAKKDEGGLH